MKKIILSIAIVAYAKFYSQVGINTSNPQGMFNIDGKKDNNPIGTPTIGQQANDFVITEDGSAGIGTTLPDASAILELNVNQLLTGKQKGFLGPRLALNSYNDSSTIPNPALGLLVFNLGTISTFTYVGYVYWNGTQWLTLDGRTLKQGTVEALKCADANLEPSTYTAGMMVQGLLKIPYTGGNGGIFSTQTIGPVNGLTATLQQGNFTQGTGTLTFNVSGTSTVNSPTLTSFPISLGGHNCTVNIGGGKKLSSGEYEFYTYEVPTYHVGLLSNFLNSSGKSAPILGGKIRVDLNFTSNSNAGSGSVTYNPRLVNIFGNNIKIWYSALSSVDRYRRANILVAPGGYVETDNGIYLNWGDNMNSNSTPLNSLTGSDDSQEIETIDLSVDGIWYRVTIFVYVDNLNDTLDFNNIRRIHITAQRMS
ncbi:hypothetical protein [Chryseobacterium culicis]|uniref:Uncharacterized protein n=1 Tax=Chryseobacterium culicis TaxID=680127 RepID=A0A1H6IRQ5_CHRCI|nr:hypothetical protein [Chryseobacterium culicis]SEH49071.1 hypothetical protein SAMN05421593_0094 [Chryseobacterium culicis]